jgi:3-dehydroquinate synthase
MQRIRVNAASSSYDVVVSGGCLERAAEEIEAVAGSRRIFVIADEGALAALGDRLERSLAPLNPTLLPIRLGEERKRLAVVEELAEQMHRAGADRSAVVVTFGGGIAGDLGGFVAASYMRGISFVQIPTTLLAQVDASVGGKTGVNLSSGKNLVGAFHQPLLVLIDPQTLATLPAQEYRAGLFEVIKHGIIWSPELFAVLENQRNDVIARDPAVLEKIVGDSVRIKASVVSEDERESGLRRILNYGHTLGHGLEAETGYQRLLHGEAVGWGMIAAGRLAESLHMFCAADRARAERLILDYGPLPDLGGVDPAAVAARIQGDKKTIGGKVHFILPSAIGKVEIVINPPADKVLAATQAAFDAVASPAASR